MAGVQLPGAPRVSRPTSSAVFLTWCIAVHAEAVPTCGADGLHGLCIALAAQPSLKQNAWEPCLLKANCPATCPLIATPRACQGALSTSLQRAPCRLCCGGSENRVRREHHVTAGYALGEQKGSSVQGRGDSAGSSPGGMQRAPWGRSQAGERTGSSER